MKYYIIAAGRIAYGCSFAVRQYFILRTPVICYVEQRWTPPRETDGSLWPCCELGIEDTWHFPRHLVTKVRCLLCFLALSFGIDTSLPQPCLLYEYCIIALAFAVQRVSFRASSLCVWFGRARTLYNKFDASLLICVVCYAWAECEGWLWTSIIVHVAGP